MSESSSVSDLPPAASTRAVFLSYASQDAEPARRICEALRAAGVEVWFDQNELRGGDAWDAKIRRQIKDCALFVPIISANTQARLEGYFRLEWHLAERRMQYIHEETVFLLPVVIDAGIDEGNARVPARFLEVQWMTLPEGNGAEKFATRVRAVLARESDPAKPAAVPTRAESKSGDRGSRRRRTALPGWARIALILGSSAVGLVFALKPLWSGRAPPADTTAKAAAPIAPEPPKPVETEAQRLTARAFELSSKLAFTRDDLAVAEDLARKATELEPENARTWAIRAWVQAAYINRSWDSSEPRREDTQRFANRALAIDPNEPEALYSLARVMITQGADAKAEALLRRAHEGNPDNGYIHRALSYALEQQGRVEEGREISRQALQRRPQDVLTHYNLASSYWNIGGGLKPDGNVEQALEHYNAALAITPFASAMVQKAALLGALRGDLRGMRATLDQLLALPTMDSTDDRSVFILAWGGLLERRPEAVRAALALTTRPYFEDNTVALPRAWLGALAYRIEGRREHERREWAAAEAVLRERLADSPKFAVLHRAQLASTLRWLGREAEAEREIQEAMQLYRERGGQGNVRVWVAYYFGAAGNAEKAVEAFAPLVDINTWFTREVLRRYPWWDLVRDAPEFQAVLADAPKPAGRGE